MKKILSIYYFLILSMISFGQNPESVDTVSLLFIGDIMGHDTQIASAFDSESGTYDYDGVFKKISHIMNSVDYTLANLEVTLAGKPHKGYPQFSSPDELAVACKNNGIDIFLTANNHSCDRGKKGIIRTIKTLDSLEIKHIGSYKDSEERNSNNLLILKKGNIRLGLLNYTYGTNGLPFPAPTIVNLIDTAVMANDIKKSKAENLDKLIVILHWGREYQSHPTFEQVKLSNFLFEKGVDIIIGSHPHVLQRMEYHPETETNKERFIAYSLGNFVSNQRTRQRDGGAMLKITLTKTKGETKISDQGYYLTWVNKYKIDGQSKFEIISGLEYEKDGFKDLDEESVSKLKIFLDDSRILLQKENINVNEINYQDQ